VVKSNPSPTQLLKRPWTLAVALLLFLVLGSILLLAWLREREQEESRRLFESLARADVEFVRQMNLPRSEKLAADLGRLLGMQIQFHPHGTAGQGSEHRIILPLDEKHQMVFIREPMPSSLSLRDAGTRNALLLFWLLAGGGGWLLLRERLKRAQSERLAMLGSVATSLAHDIKNPLASIQLHAQLLNPVDEEDQKATKLIQSETSVIAGLVNQWLHLAHPQPLKMELLDLRQSLREVAEMLEAQAQHAAVSILLHLPEPLPVLGEAAKLAQVFRNLFLNAIQAMPRGGELSVKAEKSAESVSIHFLDQGAGFSEQALKRGAEPFFSEKEGGMGLGLNIVASILAAHGGMLNLQNEPKSGARVTASLPLRDPTPS
jgi:signal transduction histidine kinase